MAPAHMTSMAFSAVHIAMHVSTHNVKQAVMLYAAQAVRPDSVVVELCRSRAAIMYSSESEQLQNSSATVLGGPQPLIPALMTGSQLLQPEILTSSSSSNTTIHISGSSSSSPDSNPSSLPLSHADSTSVPEIFNDAQSTPFTASPASASPSPSASVQAPLSLAASTSPATIPLPQRTNAFSLSGDGFLATMQRSVSLGGQSGLLFRFLLAGLVRRVAGESVHALHHTITQQQVNRYNKSVL